VEGRKNLPLEELFKSWSQASKNAERNDKNQRHSKIIKEKENKMF